MDLQYGPNSPQFLWTPSPNLPAENHTPIPLHFGPRGRKKEHSVCLGLSLLWVPHTCHTVPAVLAVDPMNVVEAMPSMRGARAGHNAWQDGANADTTTGSAGRAARRALPQKSVHEPSEIWTGHYQRKQHGTYSSLRHGRLAGIILWILVVFCGLPMHTSGGQEHRH